MQLIFPLIPKTSFQVWHPETSKARTTSQTGHLFSTNRNFLHSNIENHGFVLFLFRQELGIPDDSNVRVDEVTKEEFKEPDMLV